MEYHMNSFNQQDFSGDCGFIQMEIEVYDHFSGSREEELEEESDADREENNEFGYDSDNTRVELDDVSK